MTGSDPWYVSAFDASYLSRYAHRDQAEAELQLETLIGRRHLPAQGRVLDLCCGAGRHTDILLRRGYHVVGVDLSMDLLRAARQRIQGRSHGSLCRVDMRSLPFAAASFDAVIQMFTAFGYFADDRDNRAVLQEVARTLRGGGHHVLDLMNLEPTVRGLVPQSIEQHADGSVVEQRRSFVRERGRIDKTIRTTWPGGASEERHESVRVLGHREAAQWLHAAGLRLITVLGDYAGAAYDPLTSPRMLLVAMRPA